MSCITPKRPKPPVPVATDTAIQLIAGDGREVPLSYWDVWYALLAAAESGSDLDRLGGQLREMRGGWSPSEAAKRKLSHLRDLQSRLAEAGLCLADVLAAIPPELAKTECRRARGRIIKHNERSHELSEPMRTLPAERLRDVALRGMWSPFPVSPMPYYEKLHAKFNWRRFHEEDDSWGLAKKLDAETETALKLANKGKSAEAFAVLRSVMTVAMELTSVADDSFGCIGMSFQHAFEDYLAFPRKKVGISPEAFLTDLLELLIFEDVGFTHGHTEGFFAGLPREEADFCLPYLRGRIPALIALDLDHQAEKTLTLIGQVAAEQKRFDVFGSLATEMQSREWQRIVRLADAAETSGKHELAISVFRNALTSAEGSHFDFLTRKYEQLLNGKWTPDPRK
jgi:hypothetical protein